MTQASNRHTLEGGIHPGAASLKLALAALSVAALVAGCTGDGGTPQRGAAGAGSMEPGPPPRGAGSGAIGPGSGSMGTGGGAMGTTGSSSTGTGIGSGAGYEPGS